MPRRIAALTTILVMAAGACATPQNPVSSEELISDFDLHVATAAPGSLDPARVDSEPGRWLLKHICDPLVGIEPGTGELQPAIADSWEFAEDARTITFSLRRGVTFHNGRELTANDYVFSLSRLVRPETESPAHHLLNKVVGYREVRAGQVPFLAGVTAADPFTLVIELSEPFAAFAAVAANLSIGVAVPAEALEDPARDFDSQPVCTGPYKLESPSGSGEQIRLVRHDQYRPLNSKEASRGYPSTINWRIAGSPQAAYELLEDGRVDVAPVPHAMLSRARQVRRRVSSGASGHLSYIGLPLQAPGFDSSAVRRALARAVDRSAIVDDLLGGTRTIADSFLPKSSGPAASLTSCTEVFPPTAGADSAGESVADSALDAITIHLNEGGGHASWLGAVANQWQMALGVQSQLREWAWDEYLELLTVSGADGPFRLSWAAEYPSPESVLEPLFRSDSLDNFTRYSSDEFDSLMDQAASTIDATARAAIYSKAGSILCDDVPAIPVWFGLDHVAFGPWVAATGQERIDIFGDPLLRELKRHQ